MERRAVPCILSLRTLRVFSDHKQETDSSTKGLVCLTHSAGKDNSAMTTVAGTLPRGCVLPELSLGGPSRICSRMPGPSPRTACPSSRRLTRACSIARLRGRCRDQLSAGWCGAAWSGAPCPVSYPCALCEYSLTTSKRQILPQRVKSVSHSIRSKTERTQCERTYFKASIRESAS